MFKSWNDKSGPNYQRFYRDEVDVLLFEDLQGLAGRRATQEALLHIYNEILSRGGKVVFASSVLPTKLGEFLEPLRSRLLSGVSADIKSPSYEEKVALLSLLAQQNQISVEEPFLRILADQGHRDIRELLGVFLRLHLQARIENKTLDSRFLAREGVSFEAPQQAISLNEIISLVEHSFGISKTELISKSRKGVIAWARQVAMYLGRRFTLLSLEEIGKNFGRDHATVLYAYDKVSETLRLHPSRKYEVEFLVSKLQARVPRENDDFTL
jgi:chromosomal replication initiator protein